MRAFKDFMPRGQCYLEEEEEAGISVDGEWWR